MTTIKLTDEELNMLYYACLAFKLDIDDDWENSGWTQEQIKHYFSAEKKLFGTNTPKIYDYFLV